MRRQSDRENLMMIRKPSVPLRFKYGSPCRSHMCTSAVVGVLCVRAHPTFESTHYLVGEGGGGSLCCSTPSVRPPDTYGKLCLPPYQIDRDFRRTTKSWPCFRHFPGSLSHRIPPLFFVHPCAEFSFFSWHQSLNRAGK